MTTHAPHDLAALATAAYGEAGWVVAIAERDARPVASEHADVPLLGELFEPQYATRELFAHGWGVLGDPKPWGEWSHQADGSWTAYVTDVAGCARPGCETKQFGCRWPHHDALVECEVDRLARSLTRWLRFEYEEEETAWRLSTPAWGSAPWVRSPVSGAVRLTTTVWPRLTQARLG